MNRFYAHTRKNFSDDEINARAICFALNEFLHLDDSTTEISRIEEAFSSIRINIIRIKRYLANTLFATLLFSYSVSTFVFLFSYFSRE